MTGDTGLSPADKTMQCPKCQGAAPCLTPMKAVAKRNAIYACPACAHTFTADGGAYVDNTTELRDYFRGAELGRQTLVQSLAGEKLNPATLALLQAELTAYGMVMWNDGFKTGLLFGAKQLEASAQKTPGEVLQTPPAAQPGNGAAVPDAAQTVKETT